MKTVIIAAYLLHRNLFRLKSLVCCLAHIQCVAFNRIKETLKDVFNLNVSNNFVSNQIEEVFHSVVISFSVSAQIFLFPRLGKSKFIRYIGNNSKISMQKKERFEELFRNNYG